MNVTLEYSSIVADVIRKIVTVHAARNVTGKQSRRHALNVTAQGFSHAQLYEGTKQMTGLMMLEYVLGFFFGYLIGKYDGERKILKAWARSLGVLK